MKLTEEQESIVRDRLMESGLSNSDLAEDLLDHLCCVSEILMSRGNDFEPSLNQAIQELAPNGLKDIDNQTRFLLNSKRILNMKKFIYSIGFIGAATLCVGTLFKAMYWQGGGVLFLTGLISLFLVFAPLLAIDRYKYEVSKALSTKIKFFSGAGGAAMIGISVIFKVFHLQGSSILFVTGVMVFVFGFLPFLFFSLYKNSIS
ncbi:MAG: hypothetical protein MK086_06505 [Flavobacteriales bacterium]|nr:hypothetical protein [Flavobacteriales bacterium]